MKQVLTFELQSPADAHALGAIKALADAVYYAYGARVDGDVAEFGVGGGTTAEALSIAMRIHEDTGREARSLHLFDSFKGLPKATEEPDIDSPHVRDAIWGEGECRGITPAEARRLCEQHIQGDRLYVYDGWYSKTVAELDRRTRFAVVHVDSDLYSSAMDALTPLFGDGHISEGCIILFDDWNCNRGSPEFGERRAWHELTRRYAIQASDEGSYGIYGRKFIVHDYLGDS